MRPIKRILQIAAFPATHLCLCFIAARLLGQNDYNMNWMLVILLDLPFTFVWKLFGLPLLKPWGLIVFGTVWWLCIGVALSFIFELFERRRKPKAIDTEG